MQALTSVPWGAARLLPGLFKSRYDLNRAYLMGLANENLLQNFYREAGLWQPPKRPDGCHWGWESPTCQLRGHFLGHWLSAAARTVAGTGDEEVRAKANALVCELSRCQKENGGEWAGSIPPKYLEWAARGKPVWAPHYTVHKTLMGLYEMYALAGSALALDVLVAWARWFHRWTGGFSRSQMDDLLDVETGGMLEVWANLYAVTGAPEHKDLIARYDRPRFFDKLLAGEDVLTNRHANTTVPEVHGAARAWEVTGDSRWRAIVDAYWRMAVTTRDAFCTGGQTNGEVWTPPGTLATRLGDKNQEHCVVYNMMRLAEYLLRWTGDVAYADYMERNLYNGILAQQHPQTGMIAYFLPLRPGSRKVWGTPTDDFWCCHGTLVQAHPTYASTIYYQEAGGLTVCQYVPSTLELRRDGATIRVRQIQDPRVASIVRPRSVTIELQVECDPPAVFEIGLRLPWWISGEPTILVNGAPSPGKSRDGYHRVNRRWDKDTVRVELPKGLRTSALPDEPGTVAFLDGPIVLAGLCEEARALVGNPEQPDAILAPDNEREWELWRPGHRAVGQERSLRFVPLHEVTGEAYTVYFPVSSSR